MRLDSNIALGVKCKLDNYDGITLEVSKNGVTSVYTLSDYVNEDGYAAVYYDDIYASEIDKMITFTLKSGDEVIGTLEMSASSYLYLANNQQDENLVTLARALYAYGKCASTYQA